MEQSVSWIRSNFYEDIIKDYKLNGEKSFLYRFFRRDSVAELRKLLKELREDCTWLPAEETLKTAKELREELVRSMGDHKEQARQAAVKGRSLLLAKAPKKIRRQKHPEEDQRERKERRDFWQELWLNDAGYQAGVISDTEYYLWLVRYLVERDIYYKDNSLWRGKKDSEEDSEENASKDGGHTWLYKLLLAGLRGTEWELKPEQMRDRDGNHIRTKAQVGKDLEHLAKQIGDEQEAGTAEAAGRLHGLTLRRRTPDGRIVKADYLPWLTGNLKRLALHIKIKTWLQDSGCSLENGEKQPAKDPRKRDFSMRLFEEFCDSPEGYDFSQKSEGGGAAAAGWRVDGQGFCVLETEGIESLVNALEEMETPNIYIPLAIHIYSGCVFFLAGKGAYRKLYEAMDERSEARRRYDGSKHFCCFDYLRLEKADKKDKTAVGREFRLLPTFHENVGRSCKAVLNDFKRYCVVGDVSLRQIVREFNQEFPDGAPDVYRWAFDR